MTLRQQNIFLFTTLISLVFHMLVIQTTRQIQFKGIQGIHKTTQKLFHLKDIETEPTPKIQKPTSAEMDVTRLSFEEKDLSLDNKSKSPSPAEIEKKDFERSPPQPPVLDLKTEALHVDPLISPLLSPLDMEVRPRSISQRSLVTTDNPSATSSIPVSKISLPFNENVSLLPRHTILRENVPNVNLSEHPAAPDILQPTNSIVQEINKTIGQVKSLDSYFQIATAVYRDPTSDYTYYEFTITPGTQASELISLPKEILFVIDCSHSINHKRLEALVEGLRGILRTLSSMDRFNIIAFKEECTLFMDAPSPATEVEIHNALNFVNQLTSSAGTNVYQAFQLAMHEPPSLAPSLVLFLSDGQPTHGVRNSENIFSDTTNDNHHKRSIFTFSLQSHANRFLLDLIAYKNFGWSTTTSNTRNIPEALTDFYRQIRDPLLTNLHYQTSGIPREEIYPKSLPHLYRDTALKIYGRAISQDHFILQLEGDANGEQQRMILEGNFMNARAGGKDIARAWAQNKYYDLQSQMILDTTAPRDQLQETIKQLGQTFDIQTPYQKSSFFKYPF